MEIIDVNKRGRDAAGETYDQIAAPHVVAMGWMVNEPVRLRYPNGKFRDGNRVLVTPKGLAELAKTFPGVGRA